ncbi:MAG: hypothetical protein A3C90_04715 [Candidatus Magasanikbacteria bacterium RIFCSPHIGHO2_02_FULL_51_14]|uniref:Uncharacterized protein n=1 Tax=Candidatus Magasanikbacteria bacterium RIFCSPHIGHO2_02_FULL_51_14 TaxID=1798683 RepID=A0A1F6MHE0_9BACT|nr:MAG: hypothetical protein A3C90_04715 [Candidatus Magasanikbacteria bacterium RIFCSPHIGHO2_02_FULL_51_14]
MPEEITLEKLNENVHVIMDDMHVVIDFLRTEVLTKEDAKNFVTKDDAKNFLTKDDAKNFVTKEDAKNFATKDDISGLHVRLDGIDRELSDIRKSLERLEKKTQEDDDAMVAEINKLKRRVEYLEQFLKVRRRAPAF